VILDDLTLEVRGGDTLVLLGKRCQQDHRLKLINRLLEPTGATCWWRAVTRNSGIRALGGGSGT
jgi:ABC-type proline/glycine betaine transport system ATPase subunit